jgi:hypothetical protein
MKTAGWPILLLSLLLLSLTLLTTPRSLGAEPIKHSLFIAGPTFTGILNEDGTEAWKADRPAARDGFVLDDGRVLIAWQDEVVEYATRDKNKVSFRYKLSSANKEIATAVRLANGNTLVAELGPEPKLLEVNNESKVVTSVRLQPETDNAHMQTRMARQLPNGNYLVPHLLAFGVKEYAADGKVVSTLRTDLDELGGRPAENWPFTAVRLDNGHTIVSLTHGNKVVEFDAKGKVAWKVSNEDFPSLKPFDDPCGMQVLPNGNIVVTSYHAEKGIKVFEISRYKKIVWQYDGPNRAHGIQVLTTDGEPIKETPRK